MRLPASSFAPNRPIYRADCSRLKHEAESREEKLSSGLRVPRKAKQAAPFRAHRWRTDGLEYIRLHYFTIESWESRSNRPVQVMSHLSLFEQSVMFVGFTANLELPTQHPGSSNGLAWFQM
ncbi:hypothetical protein PMG11_01205 [Penicillium brasilianum]|uniref:Uncharacterized protein n=1 Tax=Penicillium brasilianum TaxID=104259 RepID=A0A0F7TDS6_PENBI|nr:hypothetical protein PMG11_01205 [Penicillium brasilianum]